MCQYNNINVNLHQYLKEKKIKKTQTDYWRKKKKTHETKALLQLQCAHSAKHTGCTIIYIKGEKKVQIEDWKKKKKKKKVKVANQNGTVDEQWKMLYE